VLVRLPSARTPNDAIERGQAYENDGNPGGSNGDRRNECGSRRVAAAGGNQTNHPAETVHSVKNIGTGHGAELATYVVEKGKPLITLAK
jgi:hypothetical protein